MDCLPEGAGRKQPGLGGDLWNQLVDMFGNAFAAASIAQPAKQALPVQRSDVTVAPGFIQRRRDGGGERADIVHLLSHVPPGPLQPFWIIVG